MLTRPEMEKMWQTGPIGALKSHCAANKGKKHFKIRVSPYMTVELHEHAKTYEVWSKKRDDAIWEAKAKWYHEHYDVNQTGIKVSEVYEDS